MPPPPPKRPLARPAAPPDSLARHFVSMPPPPGALRGPLPSDVRAGSAGREGSSPGGTCPLPYFSVKLWQSVHSTMVGLDSWVPTRMVVRPQ